MKTMTKITYLMFLLLFVTTAKAQFFNNEKTDEEYEITPQTNKRIIKAFLKEQKTTAIEFNPNASARFPFRLKNRKGNWMLFDLEEDAVFMEKKSNRYSFQFPTTVMENSGFTLATHKGKTFLVHLSGNGKTETKMGFDEVTVLTRQDTLYRYDHYNENGNLVYDEKESISKTLRKPAEQLAEFKKCGKIQRKKFFEGIKTTETKLNGRINPDTILLLT